jgi:dynein heavy chain 1
MQYSVPKSMSLSLWVSDFAQRLSQIELVAKEARYERMGITLGLLFTPAAYLTATRQYVAHRTKVSLDNLQLELRLNDANAEGGFLLEGES